MSEEVIEKYVLRDREGRVQHPRETALEGVHGGLQTAELIWNHEHREGMVEFRSDQHVILWNFDVGSAELKLAHAQALDMIVRDWRIVRLHSSSVIIEGHTSRSGESAENHMLSERRSKAVERYLADRGVERHRMEANHYGWERPWFPNITGAGMARNRRVEVRVFIPQETKTPLPIPQQPIAVSPVWGDVLWSEIIPGIVFEAKFPIDLASRPILKGKLMLYPSAEARVRVTVSGKRKESIKLVLAKGKWDVEFKKLIGDLVAFKIGSDGKLAVEIGGRLLKVEGEVKTDPTKPISLNLTGPSFTLVPEFDLGEGVKAKLEVLEVKVKLAVGLGPDVPAKAVRLLVRSGPAGVVVLTVAGTAAVIAFMAYITEAAQAKGLSHKRKVAYRAGYAWRVASAAIGGGYEREGVSSVQAFKAELYDATWQGWQYAGDIIKALSSIERIEVMRGLKLRYGVTIEGLAQALLVRIGGYKDDEHRPPDDLRDLLH